MLLAVAAWQEQQHREHKNRGGPASQQCQWNTYISQTALPQRAAFHQSGCDWELWTCAFPFNGNLSHLTFRNHSRLLFWISLPPLVLRAVGITLENQGANGWRNIKKKWTWRAKFSLCKCCNYYILTLKCVSSYLSNKWGKRVSARLWFCVHSGWWIAGFRGPCRSWSTARNFQSDNLLDGLCKICTPPPFLIL